MFVVLQTATVKDPVKGVFGLAIGSCVTVGGYAVGGVSGGNFNPAVSIGLALTHVGSLGSVLFYVAAQIIGICVAFGLFYITRMEQEFGASARELPAGGAFMKLDA